jgi:hypothetical protein
MKVSTTNKHPGVIDGIAGVCRSVSGSKQGKKLAMKFKCMIARAK